MLRAENIQRVLDNFGQNVVRLARIELGATRKGQRWEWDEETHSYKRGKKFNKFINNSGTLSKSLAYNTSLSNANSISFDISMADYGEWVDAGRKKGNYAPSLAIQKWVETKPIRPRNASGSFAKITSSNINSLTYLINRKIKKVGIEPTHFLSEPFNLKYKQLPEEVVEAYALDVEDFVRFSIDKLNKKYKV